METRGYSIAVVRDLPKVEVRVRLPLSAPHAGIAQLVEQCFRKAEVGGSTPLPGSSDLIWYQLAQLGQGHE